MNVDLSGKKLLILAGADVHCKVVKAAKELGVYTIVTDYLEPKYSPAKELADEYWMLDITDIETITQKCKERSVDGVINYCIDPAQMPYARICRELNLPCYGTIEQFELMTNKAKFKVFCRDYNVATVPDYTISEVERNKVSYPVLVKPSDSRGSRGQTVCYAKEEMDDAISFAKAESSDGECIIEKYMLGKQDFSLAYIVIDSKPYILKIGDRYLGKVENNLERQHICTLLPSKSAAGFVTKVNNKVVDMIRGLDLKFGAVFLQGFIDGDDVYFYDPGLRFPGGDFDIVLEKATGFNPMKSMICFALTGDTTSCYGEPQQAYKLNGGTCVILSIACRPGKIGRIEGLDSIRNMENVFSVSQRYRKGEIIPNTGDLKQRVAEVVAFLDKRDDAEHFVKKIYETINILDDSSSDMIVSKMSIDIPFGNEVIIKTNEEE